MERRHAVATGWGAGFAALAGAVFAGLHHAGVHVAGFDWASWGLDTSKLLVPALAIPVLFFLRQLTSDSIPTALLPVIGVALATVGDYLTGLSSGGTLNPIVVVFLAGLADICYTIAKEMVDSGNAPGGAALKKIGAVVGLLLLPSLAQAQGVGEFLQGITDPHLVGGVSYTQDSHKFAAMLTANVVGPKLGAAPCYVSGVGVAIGTLAPGLENSPIASASLPFLTCAPFGEAVALQVGMSIPLSAQPGTEKSYYFGVGLSLSGGPNTLKAKRLKRLEAKKRAQKAALEQGPPAPAAP